MMADPYDMDLQLPLHKFVKFYPLPNTIKVTEGTCVEGQDFSTGDVLELKELTCPVIKLTFFRYTNPMRRREVIVEPYHPAVFKVFALGKNDPYCAELDKRLFHLHGVTELVKYSPLYVRVLQGVTGYDKDCHKVVVQAGDRLNIIRFKYKYSNEQLQCKSMKNNKILFLNVNDEAGHFEEVDSHQYMSLGELTTMGIPRTWRMQLADDIGNKHDSIPGIPKDTSNVVFVLEKPNMDVFYSIPNAPELSLLLKLSTDITVSPRQETYQSSNESWVRLRQFIKYNKLPVVCTIVELEHSVAVLEHHCMAPGRPLILHRLEDMYTYIAQDKQANEKYAIPETYKGLFKLVRTKPYDSIQALLKRKGLREGLRFRCHKTSAVDSWPDERHSVVCGDMYEIISKELGRHKGIAADGKRDRVNVLYVRKIDVNCADRMNDMKKELPENLLGMFEVLTSVHGMIPALIKDLVEALKGEVDGVSYPFIVKLVAKCTEDDESHDPLPLNTDLELEFFAKEECVLASRPVLPSFYLPLRTSIDVTTVSKQTNQSHDKMSDFPTWPDRLSKEHYKELENEKTDYIYVDAVEESQPPRPRNPPLGEVPPLPPKAPKPLTRSAPETGLPPTLPRKKNGKSKGPKKGRPRPPAPLPHSQSAPASLSHDDDEDDKGNYQEVDEFVALSPPRACSYPRDEDNGDFYETIHDELVSPTLPPPRDHSGTGHIGPASRGGRGRAGQRR